MPNFRYTAIDKAGQTISGTMDAADAAAVIATLRRQGQRPIRAEPGGHAWTGLFRVEFTRSGLRRQEVANLTRELSIMLQAGQDLDRALRFLDETAPNPRMRKLIGQLRDKIRNGAALAAALSDHDRAASPGSISASSVRAKPAAPSAPR